MTRANAPAGEMMLGSEFAFPIPYSAGNRDATGRHIHSCGLTKREHFAAMAMQGMMSHTGSYGLANSLGDIADRSVAVADALLAALEKPQSTGGEDA